MKKWKESSVGFVTANEQNSLPVDDDDVDDVEMPHRRRKAGLRVVSLISI